MNPSRPFILRPVATSLLMVAVLLAGIVAYRVLPISALPEIDYPTIQVVTLYPGASPDVTTSSITAPLERQFGQMPGLRQLSKNNTSRYAGIRLFAHDRDAQSATAQQFGGSVSVDADEVGHNVARAPLPPVDQQRDLGAAAVRRRFLGDNRASHVLVRSNFREADNRETVGL